MSACFAGLDWASRTHAVCVIDECGALCLQFEISHDASGLADLVRRLRGASVTTVAIERPSGLIVDALLEAGFAVVPTEVRHIQRVFARPTTATFSGIKDLERLAVAIL